jgi:hypothetical protein
MTFCSIQPRFSTNLMLEKYSAIETEMSRNLTRSQGTFLVIRREYLYSIRLFLRSRPHRSQKRGLLPGFHCRLESDDGVMGQAEREKRCGRRSPLKRREAAKKGKTRRAAWKLRILLACKYYACRAADGGVLPCKYRHTGLAVDPETSDVIAALVTRIEKRSVWINTQIPRIIALRWGFPHVGQPAIRVQ